MPNPTAYVHCNKEPLYLGINGVDSHCVAKYTVNLPNIGCVDDLDGIGELLMEYRL